MHWTINILHYTIRVVTENLLQAHVYQTHRGGVTIFDEKTFDSKM